MKINKKAHVADPIRPTKKDRKRESEKRLMERVTQEVVGPDPLTPMPEQAFEFVLMLETGLNAATALSYFFDDPSTIEIALIHWPGHRAVLKAFERIHSKPWQQLDPSERIEMALKKHYSEMAYYLWTHHYGETWGREAEKADKCRLALEQRLAGTAGLSPLEKFWKDWTRVQAEEKAGTARIEELVNQAGVHAVRQTTN